MKFVSSLSVFAIICIYLIDGSSIGYEQDWLKGDETLEGAHPHEGLRLAGGDGWVAVGGTLSEKTRKVMVRRIDNDGNTVWTTRVGDSHKTFRRLAYSVGFSIAQDPTYQEVLYVGAGLWQKNDNHMKPAVLALDASTGDVIWTKVIDSQPKHGGVRGVIVDGERIICTGYVNSPKPGFLFVADDSKPAVWELDVDGNLVEEKLLDVEGLGQGAKIRKDASSGYVLASTAWSEIEEDEVNVVALVKLSDSLNVEWSEIYGMAGGHSQMFDILVDNEGNYLMGGHTTVGDGVVNWDYLALKVNSQTREIEFRKTFGQPRGFDPRYIHDEMYCVQLDPSGNYLLLGGSGDEYSYSETDPETGWSSDVWVSYLVVLDPQGKTLFEGVYGDKEANNAGEYMSVDTKTGDLMVYLDSDTVGGGFAFMKLSPN